MMSPRNGPLSMNLVSWLLLLPVALEKTEINRFDPPSYVNSSVKIAWLPLPPDDDPVFVSKRGWDCSGAAKTTLAE
jgi:hypothetical protein